MAQGIYIAGRRPTSKASVAAELATNPGRVRIEGTSIMGNDYDGPATELPVGRTVYFVGPDPYTARRFYGNLTRTADGFRLDGKACKVRQTTEKKPRTPKRPSMATIQRWALGSMARAQDGCLVEPDGTCPHGTESWCRIVGLI